MNLQETKLPLFVRRRFGEEDIDELISNVKFSIPKYGDDKNIDDVIYDEVREFMMDKSDFGYHGTLRNDLIGNEYFVQLSKFEEPLRDYVRSVILNTNLQESIRRILKEENKKFGLLRAIEEDGLFQVIQDTGLSMGQIILKYDNLPREVFERYIKDFINEEGYHQTDGSVQLGYEVEIQTHVYIDHFYMKGDKVTVETRRYNDHNEQTEGYIESLSNLTDEEIFSIVDDMTRNLEDNWD